MRMTFRIIGNSQVLKKWPFLSFTFHRIIFEIEMYYCKSELKSLVEHIHAMMKITEQSFILLSKKDTLFFVLLAWIIIWTTAW